MKKRSEQAERNIKFWEPGFFMETTRKIHGKTFHWHNEIEIGILERGKATELYGKRRYPLTPGTLFILWGTLPHGILKSSGSLLIRCLHIPLPVVLQWNLPSALIDPLLHGEIIKDTAHHAACSDAALLRHWQKLMDENTDEAREIVLLDARRRMLMAAKSLKHTAPAKLQKENHAAGAFERMVVAIVKGYSSPIKVREITETAGLSESYGMRLFKRISGMSINDYLTRIRISMAQRLLVTTDLKISEIARQSGFNTACRFYLVFHRHCGKTPRKYRMAMHRTVINLPALYK